MRNWSERKIKNTFIKVFYENRLLAVKWLFMLRDVREGLGERRTFRICMKYLAEQHEDVAKALLNLIAEYGRWDDLWCLLDTNLIDDIVSIVKLQIDEDIKNVDKNKPVSLLGKWLPSANTSSNETKRFAHILINKLNITERQYRKILSKLRAYINVVEVKMSAKEWSSIDYTAVPSRANLIYNNAFLRNDEERRREYLNSLQKGETKINANVLFPHDIVQKYKGKVFDVAYEEMWKALPDYVKDADTTLCVVDGSGSMNLSNIGGSKITALIVANALGIYFAERCHGEFKDKFITFSSRPKLVDLSKGKNLREKMHIAFSHNDWSNTDIESTFELILQSAIRGNMKQDEIPHNILILSDMEFDSATEGDVNKTLFQNISDKFTAHGYKMPRLIFWNLNSRTRTIPVKENDLGVALVSGFSPTVVKMVLSNNLDPLECLLEQINSERYAPVEEAIKDLV